VLGDLAGFRVDIVDEAFDAIGRMDLPLPQRRMNEAVAKERQINK
jgi:hypothetical protein